MDKQAVLKQRGQASIRQILAELGGVCTTIEAAALLDISAEEVSALVEHGELLAIELDGERWFPTWQFDEYGIVPGFAEIMGMLDTASSVGVVRFFLTHDENLEQSPIAALSSGDPKQIRLVEIVARQFNRHLAR